MIHWIINLVIFKLKSKIPNSIEFLYYIKIGKIFRYLSSFHTQSLILIMHLSSLSPNPNPHAEIHVLLMVLVNGPR